MAAFYISAVLLLLLERTDAFRSEMVVAVIVVVEFRLCEYIY